MNTSILRMSCLAMVLLTPAAVTTLATNGPAESGQGHAAGATIQITRLDGTRERAKLEGVGCSASLCSRTTLKGTSGDGARVSLWLDGIAAIQDTSDRDALFVMRDGARRRISLIKDFRVLYLTQGAGRAETLDLSKVKSIEFLAWAR